LQDRVFEAVSENKTEVPMSRFKSERENNSIAFQGYLQVDIKARRAYGIRWELKTSTGRRVDTYLFPAEFC
jgi:hypothetical protein